MTTTARLDKCRDQVGRCVCWKVAGHSEPHGCTECGSAWGDNGVPIRFPDHGPHCSVSCTSHGEDA